MGPTSVNNTSSIGHALAGMTDSVQIPKPLDKTLSPGKDSFAAVTARSAPTKGHTAGLLTPPNSLSPSLPPHAFKELAKINSRGPPTPPGPTHVDSDIDLDDEVDHAKAQNTPNRGLTTRRLSQLQDLEAVGSITPTMLAKHHLPGILLQNGPLAIRHIMGFLTTSVPGFSGIPPAKARRLVVGALEGRGSDGQQGGLNGDVLFEKVGWGRWKAKKRGQSKRERTPSRYSPPAGSLRIPPHSIRKDRTQRNDTAYGSYQGSDVGYDSPADLLDNHSVGEHDADNMSLDGGSDSPFGYDRANADSMGEETEEEDWASIGAAALRENSRPGAGVMPTSSRSRSQQRYRESKARLRGTSATRPSSSAMSKSAPATRHLFMEARRQHQLQHQRSPAIIPEDAFREEDTQDREAVEALLKLSSC